MKSRCFLHGSSVAKIGIAIAKYVTWFFAEVISSSNTTNTTSPIYLSSYDSLHTSIGGAIRCCQNVWSNITSYWFTYNNEYSFEIFSTEVCNNILLNFEIVELRMNTCGNKCKCYEEKKGRLHGWCPFSSNELP